MWEVVTSERKSSTEISCLVSRVFQALTLKLGIRRYPPLVELQIRIEFCTA
jgi:hypothetical protein